MQEPTLEPGDFDIDFGVGESGRAMVLSKLDGIADESSFVDEMEFSLTNSSRNVEGGNAAISERSMNTIGTIGTIDSTIGSVSSSILDSSRSIPDGRHNGNIATQSEVNTTEHNQHSFQPLVPLDESTQRPRSASRAIPIAPQQHAPIVHGPPSQPNSAGSTGSSFLNNILNPSASTFNNTQLSHTPPTNFSTSYEASHFGKRARSGSISERLRVSSELEEKGMIDRDQKGILKDLIISGKDDELQHALDRYEMGDTKMLEEMLQSGTLSGRAATDIDLLGDLDLDFLTVNDDEVGDGAEISGSYASTNPMQPPPTLPNRQQGQQMAIPPGSSTDAISYEASDGIGELDFDGGIEGGDGYATMQSHDRTPSPIYSVNGQRSRSNSTFSIDYEYRSRSNSLFSALIGTAPNEGTPTDYGRWMERNPGPSATTDLRTEKLTRRKSAPELPTGATGSIPGGSVQLTAAEKREIRAEEKRRERQERKKQKEKEKREKREKREQAKLEKQRKAENEEKVEHQPGSGRPRSMSDPNLKSTFDVNGLLQVERPDGWIGAYSPESRKVRIARFLEKRNHRVWTKTVKYDVRKNFADSRLRVKGRFVKKEDELLMRELMSLT